MPARDQSGPFGNGPEGRGMGPCKEEVPGGWFGFGRRSGRGGGRFWRRSPGYGRGFSRNESEDVQYNNSQNQSLLNKILERLDALEKKSNQS